MIKQCTEEAQINMHEVGVYAGAINGEFGPESLQAVNDLIEKAGFELPKPKQVGTDLDAPAWITEGQKHLGLREVKGGSHNLTILSWIEELGGWFRDDETPWCGTYVAICLKRAGRNIPKHWYRALAYADYGTKLNMPAYGAIGVMGRKGGGHVTMIVGVTKDGKYLIGQGGNQSDSVNLMKFPRSRFTAWVWPEKADGTKSIPLKHRYNLPVYDNNMQLSTKED